MSVQRTLRFTARITVEIDEFGQLIQVLRDSLTQAVRAAVPARPSPPAVTPPPPPLRPVREPAPIKPMPERPEGGQDNRLLNTKQVAKLLNIGERTLWRYWNSGRVLRPIKIGGAVRWRAAELQQWMEAGCPATEKWMKMKKGE